MIKQISSRIGGNLNSLRKIVFLSVGFVAFTISSTTSMVHALELDWSGQFRSEFNFIQNYEMDVNDGAVYDGIRAGAGGYYIPSGGSTTAYWETLFLKLRPKIVVNDNIYIKSEFWLGDPTFGFFGNAAPYSNGERQFYSNQLRGSTITAQRFWAEFLSDIGTFQIGQAPLDWGLGIVWNAGDGLWDHYESTGDVIRLVAKFGAFSFVPAAVFYSIGNSIGGSCSVSTATGLCPQGSATGSQSVADYSLMVKYENPDEDFEAGINFIKRIAGAGQDVNVGYQGPDSTNPGSAVTPPNPAFVSGGSNYNIYDIFGRKKFGRVSVAAEIPITTGNVGGINYSAVAIATETKWNINDTWDVNAKIGRAPGEGSQGGTTFTGNYNAFYFNPTYKIGLIMFNYQLANIAGLSTQNAPYANQAALASPYDNPITNANYISLGGALHSDKWTFNGTWIFALADQTCSAGQFCYNSWTRSIMPSAATENQSNALGTELDLGATFQWDEYFQFGLQVGAFLPGQYYAFSNAAGLSNGTDNATNVVFATVARVGVTF